MKPLVEKYNFFELSLNGPSRGNPFLDVNLQAVFKHRNRELPVEGFYDGNGVYKLRFMPDEVGEWWYITESSLSELHGKRGSFQCSEAGADNHGPVRVTSLHGFAYDDGTPYLPFGTTCYAWIHQGDSLEKETLSSLKKSPFNKLRMCVFPKRYPFNENEPAYYPFEGEAPDRWDFDRFNPVFFAHLEERLIRLRNMGIEADLILFHPYDQGHWGFDRMSPETDRRYLRYVAARLAAFRNVWWSLANEFDLMGAKAGTDWDDFFRLLQSCDPYQHLRSIHNCAAFYDHGKPWVTHCSIQSSELERVTEWGKLYGKPVIVDECRYEGNIDRRWGNLTAEEMVHRIWTGVTAGGYVGHGETYMHPDDILWWAKGGKLHGSSPERIAFLQKLAEEDSWGDIRSLEQRENAIGQLAGREPEYYVHYFGIHQPSFRTYSLPTGHRYRVDVIDTWRMTIDGLEGAFGGVFTVLLPARPYLAVRIRKA